MIDHLDHLVLTTTQESACIDFYTRILGMRLERFISGTPPIERRAFLFGHQKINLHLKGKEFEPKAHLPVPGALDLCFVAAVACGRRSCWNLELLFAWFSFHASSEISIRFRSGSRT